MKYELLKDQTITQYGKTLYQIKALKSFSDIRKGDLGGYIEKESNLSQYDSCWVYGDALVYNDARVFGNAQIYGDAQVYGYARVSGDARVSGKAQVYGDAWVSGNAQVSGKAECTSLVQTCVTTKHNITLTDNHIIMGCENHTIDHWRKNIVKIGHKHDYTDKEIRSTINIIKGLLGRR